MFPAQWDSLQRAGEVAGVVDEAVSGVRVVKGFGQEDRELGRPHRRRRRSLPVARAHRAPAGAVPVGAAGDPGARAGRRCSRSGGWLAIEGQITIGTFLAFSTYLVQLLAPVRMFAGMVAVAEQARAGTERIFELLDSNPLVIEQPRRRGRSWRPTPRSCSTTSPTGTCARSRCCATSRCGSRRARRSRSSVRPVRASRP